MNSVRIQTGATERIEALCLDASRDPVTGKTDILLQIRRVSDGFFYDFNDNTFKSSGWTTLRQQMTETDVTNDAGNYHYDFDTSAIVNATADDTYEIRVIQSPGTDVKNLPQTGEIKVGQYVDDLDVAVSSRSSHTANNVRDAILSDSTPFAGGNIDAAISSRSSHSASDVWAVGSRTLTSFGTLVSDIWSAGSRTLTSFGTLTTDTATAVWAHATRTLTSFGTLVSDIWSNPARTLTSFGTLVSDVSTAVWGAGTRTLTSFGTLVVDVWAHSTRTLTSFGSLVSDVATAVWGAAARTLTSFGTLVTDITTSVSSDLSTTHGSGSWEGATPTQIWQYVIEGTLTAEQYMRIIFAATALKSAGGGTTTLTFRNLADDKDRITATVDVNGNRTAITLDGT